jgi:hypothetical protein
VSASGAKASEVAPGSLADLALARETIKVNYAGYWAAEEGRRVVL